MKKRFGKIKRPMAYLCGALFFLGCGSKEKKTNTDPVEETKSDTYVSYFKGGTVSFSKEEAGKNFVLMPYQLGDPAKIEGGNNDKFTMKGQRQSAAGLQGEESSLTDSLHDEVLVAMSRREIDHNLRTLINRFDPSKGMDQGQWFWHLARALDRAVINPLSGKEEAFLASAEGGGGIEDLYLRSASKGYFFENNAISMNLTASSCPTSNVTLPDPSDPAETDEAVIPAGGVVSDENFCIVYLSDPKTETDKEKIKNSVKKVINIYKNVVYKDVFAQAADGYSFKPVVVVVDFGDASKWPAANAYQVVGAYIRALSNKTNQPMIYMASDVNNIKSNQGVTLDRNLTNRQWHGTLAHEMQHAIIDYYRTHKTKGVSETPAIDEGLAHYMEDLFGYGEENFKDFAKAYLDLWAETNPPVLHAADSGKIERGGGWLLWYYLISQKGGVSFTEGVVSGGDGLEFVRAVVQNTTQRGPSNLASKFGKDWTETIGGFLGAIVVDGSSIPTKPKEFVVQDPQPVVDLTGVSTKKYGMHFNNFGGLAAVRSFSDKMFKSGAALEDLTYYATSPVRLDNPGVGDVVKFQSSSDAPNFAVIKVRLN